MWSHRCLDWHGENPARRESRSRWALSLDVILMCNITCIWPLCVWQAGSPSIRRASPVSVYLFPGEAPKPRPSVLEGEESDLDGLVTTAMEVHADVMSEEGSECSEDNDDFCILEAPGMGIPVCIRKSFCLSIACFCVLSNHTFNQNVLCLWQPRDGEPVVTLLSQGPIKVRDGYFSRPRGSSDLLRAPASFPVPQNRLVLREVSVIWHLYGGKDFGGKPSSGHPQHGQK